MAHARLLLTKLRLEYHWTPTCLLISSVIFMAYNDATSNQNIAFLLCIRKPLFFLHRHLMYRMQKNSFIYFADDAVHQDCEQMACNSSPCVQLCVCVYVDFFFISSITILTVIPLFVQHLHTFEFRWYIIASRQT